MIHRKQPLDLPISVFFPSSNFRLPLFPNPIHHISSLLPIHPSAHPHPPHTLDHTLVYPIRPCHALKSLTRLSSTRFISPKSHHTPLLLAPPLLPSFPLPTPTPKENTAQRLTSTKHTSLTSPTPLLTLTLPPLVLTLPRPPILTPTAMTPVVVRIRSPGRGVGPTRVPLPLPLPPPLPLRLPSRPP